jgi:hypothetical protein
MRMSKDISRRQLISMIATLRGQLGVPGVFDEEDRQRVMALTAFGLSEEDGEWFEELEEVKDNA